MTKISATPPGGPHAAQQKAHAHKHTAAMNGQPAPFLALLALLNPSADPDADPSAATASDATASAQADRKAASAKRAANDRAWDADTTSDRDRHKLPGAGGALLPIPIVIAQLAPGNAPTASSASPPTISDQRKPAMPIAPGRQPIPLAGVIAGGSQPGQAVQPDATPAQAELTAQAASLAQAILPGSAPALLSATPTLSAGQTIDKQALFAPAAAHTPQRGYAPDVHALPQLATPPPAVSANSGASVTPPTVITASAAMQAQRQHSGQTKGDHQPAFATAAPVLGASAPTGPAGPAPFSAVASAHAPTPAAPHPGIVSAGHQIAMQAQLVQQGQQAEMRMRLRPPELGEVHVTMRRDDAGKLTVHLIPATHEGEAALRANLHHLRAALDQHNPNQGADVSLGQRESSRQGQNAHHQSGDFEELSPTGNGANAAQLPSANRTSAPSQRARGALDYDA